MPMKLILDEEWCLKMVRDEMDYKYCLVFKWGNICQPKACIPIIHTYLLWDSLDLPNGMREEIDRFFEEDA